MHPSMANESIPHLRLQ